jgi:galactoside O-acetyltransferase|tara:strand:- start:2872 stop:3438 length:567 start_codon:yes stop_codon:yes gene_type:complete
MNYFSTNELKRIGFKKIGKNVQISKNVNFYNFHGSIGSNCRIDDHSIFIGEINMGNYVHIAAYNLISASRHKKKISISSYTGIGPKCYISCVTENYVVDDTSNPTMSKKRRKSTIFADINIGKNVLIGAGCSIIPRTNKKINIGNNVSIATNTIISKNVKNNCIIYNPYNYKNNSLIIKKNINNLKKK